MQVFEQLNASNSDLSVGTITHVLYIWRIYIQGGQAILGM